MDETLANLQVRISASSGDAAEKVDALAKALGRLKKAVEAGVGDLGAIAQQLDQLSNSAGRAGTAATAVDRLATALQKLSGLNISPNLGTNISATVDALSRINIGNIAALSAFAAALRALSGINVSGLAALNGFRLPNIPTDIGDRLARLAAAVSKIPADAARKLSDLATAFRQLENINLDKVNESLRELDGKKVKIRMDTSEVKKAQKNVGILGTILRSLGRIAFYRIIRSAIKAIGEAFAQGAENAYWYSKTIGDGTKYISEAYDSIASKSFTMDNQLGAAWATWKAAIAPVLIEIIQLATRAAEAITHLIAALSGRTQYLRAKDTIKEAYENTAKGAAAAKEWKNQLMGFDEINRLEEPSSGGGGGGADVPDYRSMFEEVDVNSKLREFLDTIKQRLQPAIERCKEAFGRLKEAWEGLVASFSYAGGPIKNLIEDLLTLGGNGIINGITVLADVITLLFDTISAFNDPKPDAWFKTLIDKKQLVYDIVVMVGDLLVGLTNLAMDAFILIASSLDALIGTDLAGWLQEDKDAFNDMYEASKNSNDGLLGLKKTLGLTQSATKNVSAAADGFKASLSGVGALSIETERKVSGIRGAVEWVIDGFRWFGTEVSNIFISLFQPIADFCAWIDSAIQGLRIFNGVNRMQVDGSIYLQGFASGGFPSTGELFLAREAGPELVGTMNGQTAVANNQEITEGIYRAAYQAFTDAMSGGGSDRDVYIYLDGREIANTTTRYQRQFARANG